MVVTILSQYCVGTYYRFYGARHSVLQLGYLIDYEVEQDKANFLPRVRGVSHIGFPWLYDREKLMYWHRFISIFEPHLRDINEIDSFYYNAILDSAKKWQKQSFRRLIVEKYVNTLQYEGRLHSLESCIICKQKIDKEVSLLKGFLPTHPHCSHTTAFIKKDIEELFLTNSTIDIDSKTTQALSEIVLKGF